jgi:DNA-binding CsgD family transcriptional regulator
MEKSIPSQSIISGETAPGTSASPLCVEILALEVIGGCQVPGTLNTRAKKTVALGTIGGEFQVLSMIPDVQLSKREQEVLGLLLEGKSNKQMALALAITIRTVEFHLKNVYAKFQVSSRVELILKLRHSTHLPEAKIE